VHNHVSDDYICPFCMVVAGCFEAPVLSVPSDTIFQDDLVTVFLNICWWKNNPAPVLIVPNKHVENLYDLPKDLSAAIHELEREVAIALKRVYGCDGTSSRQHNEPAGNQEVFHYHLHVFPRWQGDRLYGSERRMTSPEERLPYAEKLSAYFKGFKR